MKTIFFNDFEIQKVNVGVSFGKYAWGTGICINVWDPFKNEWSKKLDGWSVQIQGTRVLLKDGFAKIITNDIPKQEDIKVFDASGNERQQEPHNPRPIVILHA